MIRALSSFSWFGAIAFVASFASAPVQCKHDPDPNLRHEDDAGDALYALAQDFRARGNEQAAQETLRFLVEKYPSNRHVPAAKAELEGSPPERPGLIPRPPAETSDAGR